MLSKAVTLLMLAQVLASPIEVQERDSCPPIHVFGARETTAPAGMGTAGTVVSLITGAHSGATSEAINYPACGGQSACGGVSYGDSAKRGVAAVVSAVNSYNSKCPNTQLVLVGYSQGGQIMDDAVCGGGDLGTPLTAAARAMVKAAIFMGDPRHIPGLPYNVGTCNAKGFAPHPSGFTCQAASLVQSYCDSADPYCCNGNDANTHQGYGREYGQAALKFVNGKLSSGSSSPAPTSTKATQQPATTKATTSKASIVSTTSSPTSIISSTSTSAPPPPPPSKPTTTIVSATTLSSSAMWVPVSSSVAVAPTVRSTASVLSAASPSATDLPLTLG